MERTGGGTYWLKGQVLKMLGWYQVRGGRMVVGVGRRGCQYGSRGWHGGGGWLGGKRSQSSLMALSEAKQATRLISYISHNIV